MFRISATRQSPELFGNFVSNMDGAREKKFNDTQAWHNVFHKHVVSRIDEKPFACLFDSVMGAPNEPIRVLIGMMVMKEGFGWSDKVMFEQCDFNIQVMSALGLTNVGDSVPCEATYYNIRQAIYKHQVATGEDLIGGLFTKLTKEQAKVFGVHGALARMDSKLIGSNICKSTRLQLVIGVLQQFYKDINKQGVAGKINEQDRGTLDELMKKKAGQIVYGKDKQERESMLENLGYLMSRLIDLYLPAESENHHLLVRVLSEQYHIEGVTIQLKEAKEVSSDSLQSPFDEDAAFREKHEQKVQGFSMNVTETCNQEENVLNLIGDVKLEKATVADPDFVEGSVNKTQEAVGHIDHLNTDGAYHSVSNQEFAKKNITQFVLSGLPGKKGVYEYEPQQDGSIQVINTQTKEVYLAENYKEGKYKFRENGILKYFTTALIDSFLLRNKYEQIPLVERNIRNNVEATIFQMCYPLRKDKTRYRGLIKNQMWAYSRAMWVNAKRITIFMGKVCPDGTKNGKMNKNLTIATRKFIFEPMTLLIRSIKIVIQVSDHIFNGTRYAL